MLFRKYTKKWIVILLLTFAAVPILITGYEVIFTTNKSVNFLGSYHPKIAILVVSYYVILSCLAFFWFAKQLVLVNKLKNESAKTELALLKNQVNPHFFFNMLNNLYGLVSTDTIKAQQLILKMSDLMRYSIYEGERHTVSIEEEIDFLKNYVEIHQMRYHRNVNIDFNCTIDKVKEVVPLLFLILLENSFKHGVENLREEAYIKVDLVSTKKYIKFTLENNYEGKGNKTGIGLKNLKRRLDLTYPNQHELSFSITANVYQVQLTLF